jgi:hypothetical protein
MAKRSSSIASMKNDAGPSARQPKYEFLCLRDSASQSATGTTRDFDVIITAAERSDRLLPNTSSLQMQYGAGAYYPA